MSWILRSAVQRLTTESPVKMTVRFWEKRPYLRRYGYENPLMEPGLLPRLEKSKRKLKSQPIYTPKDAWSERRALFGQNDYIDILGSGDVKPLHIMQKVPFWLRGFQGNEFKMLLHRRRVHQEWKEERPTRYRNMAKRIRFLYKVLNHRTKT